MCCFVSIFSHGFLAAHCICPFVCTVTLVFPPEQSQPYVNLKQFSADNIKFFSYSPGGKRAVEKKFFQLIDLQASRVTTLGNGNRKMIMKRYMAKLKNRREATANQIFYIFCVRRGYFAVRRLHKDWTISIKFKLFTIFMWNLIKDWIKLFG